MINQHTKVEDPTAVPELIVLTLVYGTNTKHDLDHIT